MAIEFFTGFEGCGKTSDIQAMFTAIYSSAATLYNATNGYSGGKCCRVYANYVQKECTASKTKVWGQHIKGASTYELVNSVTKCLVRFIGPDIYIYNSTTGLKISRGTTLIATIGTGLSISQSLTHVQAKLFSDVSAGTIEIYINGALYGSATGLNTGGQDITSILIGGSNGSDCYIDNIYISDQIEGELISQLCKPTTDDVVQFYPLTGNDNYAMIDDTAQDGDTTYVHSETGKDTYVFEDIPAGYTVKAATLVMNARKNIGDPMSLKMIAIQDAVEYDIGSVYVLGTTYPDAITTAQMETISLAPDGTAWSNAKFNACKWGFKNA